MKKKNVNNNFKKVKNEKQNSLASGIRIDSQGNLPVLKQRFVRVKEVEYSTDFDFFICNQVHVIHHRDRTTSICSRLEERCFRRDATRHLDDKAIMDSINQIHHDIITFKYGGELIYE